MKNHRILSLIFVALMPWQVLAQALQAHLESGSVHVTAPQLRFLSGRVLERLHNGAAIPFRLQLTAVPVSGGKAIAQASGRFVLSFDLWEERFSVVQESPRRTVSNLSSVSAEAWCVDSLSIPASALQNSFVLKLEVRAEETAEESEKGPALSMAGLIDIFSRKPKEEPLRWMAVTMPLRIQELKEQAQRGKGNER